MIDFPRWFGGADSMPGVSDDLLWAWVTLSLSLLVVIGYLAIAVNWYFQAKLSRVPEARAALGRLRGICLSCALCGGAFYVTQMPWLAWRFYDAILLVVVFHTWFFLLRMRGLSLVDERLAQLEELERSASRYREIAELLPHVVWTASGEGKVDFANQAWRQYAGGERTWIDAVHPDEKAHALLRWQEAVVAREPMTLEVRLRGAEGYRTFVIRATTIVHGDAVKWLGACADVEDQKLLAEEKERQAREKSFFLNALSHDLRAPLHNVLLNAHLLKMSARDVSDLESVNMIMENAVAAGDLVTRLLDFARVGAADHNVMEPVALEPLLQQVVRRFLPRAQLKGLFLRFARDGGVLGADVTVPSDRHKLERIISNLVDNAIKYTERGGISLELAATTSSPSASSASAAEGQVIIRVADTGIGIPPENVPYLFDEFYQVNNYERDRSKGFGMGLAICRNLAHHVNGELRLAGTGPHGSSFELRLQRSLGADRGGRRGGSAGDDAAPQAAGLCGV